MNLTLLDFARVSTSVVAAICMMLMAQRAHRARVVNGDEFTIYATSALLVFMALVVVSQLQQFGHPLRTGYGLPMLALGSILTLIALAKSKV